jgi:hypothetical protein
MNYIFGIGILMLIYAIYIPYTKLHQLITDDIVLGLVALFTLFVFFSFLSEISQVFAPCRWSSHLESCR